MLTHYRSIHEGIKYLYNQYQCDYQATQQGHLQTHIQSKHEDKVYLCNHCEFRA